MSVRFTQSCPTCGRRVQVAASLLGRTVACQHCQAQFVATSGLENEQAGSGELESLPSLDPLMMRVEEALERARQDAAMT